MALPAALKIADAKVKNFRRVKLVELKPEQNFIIVAGKNANGKTSFLDALACALSGSKPDFKKPVHGSEDKAEIEVTLTNGINIKQYVTNTGTYGLKVTTGDGGGMTAGQTFLKRFYDELQFEPMEFVRTEPRKQVAMLKGLAGLDFTSIDEEIAELRQTAKDAKAECTRLEGLMSNLPDRDLLDNAPDEEVSVSQLSQKLTSIQRDNLIKEQTKARKSTLCNNIEIADKGIAELQARIQKIEQDKAGFLSELEELEKLPVDPTPTADLETEIENAEATNRLVRTKQEREKSRVSFKAKAQEEYEANEKIKALQASKKKQLEEAQFPIEGLSFDETGVTFGGIPLEERSASEQLRVCLAIAKATRRQMAVLIIRDASLLDEDAMAEVEKFAEDNDIQILMEVVGDGDGNAAIVIEDGRVKEAS